MTDTRSDDVELAHLKVSRLLDYLVADESVRYECDSRVNCRLGLDSEVVLVPMWDEELFRLGSESVNGGYYTKESCLL